MKYKIVWRWRDQKGVFFEGWVQDETSIFVLIGDREWSSGAWYKKDEIEIYTLPKEAP